MMVLLFFFFGKGLISHFVRVADFFPRALDNFLRLQKTNGPLSYQLPHYHQVRTLETLSNIDRICESLELSNDYLCIEREIVRKYDFPK